MPRRKRKRRWKSSFTLNRIRHDADDLRSRIPTLPRYLSARRLARFLGVSKTPVLQWIRRGNLATTKRGKRLVVERNQIEALIAAACDAEHYFPPIRPPFLILRRRRRLNSLSQKNYSVAQLAHHLQCSTSTIRRAIRDVYLHAYHKTPGRWAIKRDAILWSPAFFRPRRRRLINLHFSEKSS